MNRQNVLLLKEDLLVDAVGALQDRLDARGSVYGVRNKVKHIVAYSGGLGSFFAAKRIVDRYGPEDVTLVFCDTNTEDEDLYRFINETVSYLGCEFILLNYGLGLWELFEKNNCMANSVKDTCSDFLKRRVFKKYINSLIYKKGLSKYDFIIHYGIGWNEYHRLDRLRDRYYPYIVYAAMCEPPYLDTPDMISELKYIKIKPPRLYSMGFPHNNCGGFCVKAGAAQFKLLLEKLPDRFMWHEHRQEKLFSRIGHHGFIRKSIQGKVKYLSLKELRIILENKICLSDDELNYDYGGCECFS